MKVPPRPAQFEALAIWELIARNQQQKKFETRIRKVEKTLADTRWDSTQKIWRSDVLQGIKLFPAITDEAETEGRKATHKTNRSQSRDRENNRNSKRGDESDDEEFIIQLLNDRPPPYVESEKDSSISTAPPEPIQGNVTPNLRISQRPSSSDMPFSPQIPQIQRIYPDVPTLKPADNYQPQVQRHCCDKHDMGMTSDSMAQRRQNYQRPTLIQAESTQFSMPQKQTQEVRVIESQLGMPAMMNHNVGINMPQNLGNRQNPDAISLPITVGPPVPLNIQANSSTSDQGLMIQNGTGRRCIETTPETTPIAALPNGSGSLSEFSPIPICAPSTVVRSHPPLLVPLTSETETLQKPSVAVDVTAALMGLNAQQLTQWFNSLNSPQSTSSGKGEEYLNKIRLGMEADELVEGTMGLNRLESYTEEELRYMCPRITREVSSIHKKLQEIADRNDIDINFWEDCKRAVGWPTSEPERDRDTGAPSPTVMSLYHKVIEHLKTKVASKNVDWQRIDRTAQEVKESIHVYYERLLKAFKNYSGTETIEAKDMLHFVFRFVEGLRPEISQMIKTHLICWQSKSIDEVLNYAKYCSDEIETKQKRLKEKVIVMQLRAAQTGLQGLQGFQQQMPQQQQQGNAMFQPQMRGRGRGGFVNNGPDLNTVMIPNGIQAMKKVMPCHTCGIVGHWKRECPMMVQEGVGQQNNDVNAFQTMRGPKLRGPNPNFQNNINQLQGLQPMQPQQVQMPRVQMTQLQPMQQQFPMVPNQQMQIPLAPMNQQQAMLPQQVTGQGMNQNDTVHQFPLHSENGINDVWESESSDEEGNCVLAASLEVDQKGPYVEGRVMGHRVSFLVDTGATRSTVRSIEVPNLPL
ncbi:hypothetical protein NDU88_003321 [Pleurodeles waltl]|uniref:CCHC-type domain-containing protein n=1 Tax=Pleurodeles waltl TaxID=8319 RepID=A0AAV7WRB6_PLEWA|nr:hypothetical protein NDU88_003321 [Pleurodeles waltl]